VQALNVLGVSSGEQMVTESWVSASMRLGPTLVLFLAVAHPVWAQEQPKPSEKQTGQTTETKQTPEATAPTEIRPTENSTSTSTSTGTTNSTATTNMVLPEGTVVKLKLLHTLNSKTVVLDDPLNFSVAEDVVVDGKSVVKAGSPAIGRVRQAKRASTMGRGAELGLEMQYMKAGRIRVPLRGSAVRQGEDKTGETVALTVLFGLSGLMKHGSEIAVREGSLFTAYVNHDTNVMALPETSSPRQDP
jgi:hypothetical protein